MNDSYLNNYIDEFVARVTNKCVDAYIKAGDMVVAHAKETGNYSDHTTHLRSSVGYIVVLDGTVVKQGGFGNNQGGTTGLEVAKKFISGGLELIVVAGMHYARYVEAKNYNVLTSAEHYAGIIVPQLLKQLGL